MKLGLVVESHTKQVRLSHTCTRQRRLSDRNRGDISTDHFVVRRAVMRAQVRRGIVLCACCDRLNLCQQPHESSSKETSTSQHYTASHDWLCQNGRVATQQMTKTRRTFRDPRPDPSLDQNLRSGHGKKSTDSSQHQFVDPHFTNMSTAASNIINGK